MPNPLTAFSLTIGPCMKYISISPVLKRLSINMDQIFARAREGDEKAEQELFKYLFVRFKTLAERRIGKGEAEDIAQEACMTVLQKYKTETFK